jgi:hypothetical protein
MCIKSASVGPGVYHYYNTGYSSAILDPTHPTLGLSSTSLTVVNSVFTCSFTRANSNPLVLSSVSRAAVAAASTNSMYLNVNAIAPYLISAYGPTDSTGSKFAFILLNKLS